MEADPPGAAGDTRAGKRGGAAPLGMKGRHTRWLTFGASALLAIGLLAWLLRDIGAEELLSTFADASPRGIAMFVPIALLVLLLRALRYRLLLGDDVPFWPLTLVTQVRGMLVDLLPARAGSLSYLVLLNRRLGVAADRAVASFYAAFLLDLAALGILLAICAWAAISARSGDAPAAPSLVVAAATLTAAAGAVLWTSPALLRWGASRLQHWAGSRPAGDTEASSAGRVTGTVFGVISLARGVASQIGDQLPGSRLPALMVLSLAIRVGKYASYWLLLSSVLVPHGVPLGGVDPIVATLGAAAGELSGALPIQGLGGFGTWEGAWALGLQSLGGLQGLAGAEGGALPPQAMVLVGFATHVLSQAWDYSLGIVALLLLMLPGRRRAS